MTNFKIIKTLREFYADCILLFVITQLIGLNNGALSQRLQCTGNWQPNQATTFKTVKVV